MWLLPGIVADIVVVAEGIEISYFFIEETVFFINTTSVFN